MNNKNMNADKTMLRVGTTLERGKYRIDRYLSSGGFGNTYLATNVSFDERVAIKEFFMKDINMRAGESTSVSLGNVTQMPIFQEQMEKFKTEARRLRKLKHRNIVEVSDLFDENGTTYYVMDYIDGQSLRDMVQQRGKLVEQEVRGYLDQVLNALEVVHQKGFYHLDIKPANIMVDKTGRVRVIDFGASKQQTPDGGATSRSAICYTPGYAPIEQKDQERENFGPWTDLYALGATLYNCLTGETPPSTSKIADFGEQAFQFPATVSDEMQQLILWMMKGSRFNRPQSVAAVKAFLKGEKPPVAKPPFPDDDDDSDDDATILTPLEDSGPELPPKKEEEKPKTEEPKKVEPKKVEPKKVEPKKAEPKKVEPKKVEPKNTDPKVEEQGNGSKRKYIYAGLAAVAAFLVIYALMPTGSSLSGSGADTGSIVAASDNEVVTDSFIVTNKAFKNEVQGEYLYSGPVNTGGLPNGIGHAVFITKGEPNGMEYNGPFLNGTLSGLDAKLSTEFYIFEGTFSNNLFEKGKLTDLVNNGEYFEGTFKMKNPNNPKEGAEPYNGTWYDKNGKAFQKVENFILTDL